MRDDGKELSHVETAPPPTGDHSSTAVCKEMSAADMLAGVSAIFKADNESEAMRVRRAWLRQIQIENKCPTTTGQPCHSHKCGCALEMQNLIEAAPSDAHGTETSKPER